MGLANSPAVTMKQHATITPQSDAATTHVFTLLLKAFSIVMGIASMTLTVMVFVTNLKILIVQTQQPAITH